MGIKEMLKKIRDDYVIGQVEKREMPEFGMDKTVRYYVIFSGRVQGVGFRMEARHLAVKLQLTGWIRNLDDGNVEMEIQGMRNKIEFLLESMNSLKWIRIDEVQKEVRDVLKGEKEFVVRY